MGSCLDLLPKQFDVPARSAINANLTDADPCAAAGKRRAYGSLAV